MKNAAGTYRGVFCCMAAIMLHCINYGLFILGAGQAERIKLTESHNIDECKLDITILSKFDIGVIARVSAQETWDMGGFGL